MAVKSQTLDNALLNAILRNGTYTGPVTVFVALFTVVPTPTTGGTEVTDSNYARQSATFSAASGGQTANTGLLSFFGSGAAGNVGSVVAVALMDASTAGNILYFSTLAAPKTINTGDTMSFAVGALAVGET